jgi:hypothetical protein
MRRSNSNGCVMDRPQGGQQPQPHQPQPISSSQENGQQQSRSRRSSRSNSRQGSSDMVDSGVSIGAAGGIIGSRNSGRASSSQSDQRSDGGYKSDGWYQQRSQPPQPSTKRPDGYRSEGSTESPKHHQSQLMQPGGHPGHHHAGHHHEHHHHGGSQSVRSRSSSSRSRPGPGMTQQPGMQAGPPPPTSARSSSAKQHGPACHGSRSLQSFQRQESTGSFYSSHSAPNCGSRVGHGHSHMMRVGVGGPGQVGPPPNLESCSTQSSSSSASGPPPDYNTCGAPPPYDAQTHKARGYMKMGPGELGPPKVPPHQGSHTSSASGSNNRHKSQKQGASSSVNRSNHFQPSTSASSKGPTSSRPSASASRGSNELYYMGEFYG